LNTVKFSTSAEGIACMIINHIFRLKT